MLTDVNSQQKLLYSFSFDFVITDTFGFFSRQ